MLPKQQIKKQDKIEKEKDRCIDILNSVILIKNWIMFWILLSRIKKFGNKKNKTFIALAYYPPILSIVAFTH